MEVVSDEQLEFSGSGDQLLQQRAAEDASEVEQASDSDVSPPSSNENAVSMLH